MAELTQHTVKVDAKQITDADYEAGCRILSASVKRYFEQPDVKESYEAWLETDEGKRAALPSSKRRRDKESRNNAPP